MGAALLVIQAFQPARNKGSKTGPQDLAHTVPVPAGVQQLLNQACYDCHSNQTAYPWYSYLQPFAWWQKRHVTEGKQQLNFTTFGTYSHRRQASKLKAIAGTLNDGSMPLPSYTWVHPAARLSSAEKQTLAGWATRLYDSLQKAP